MALKSLHSSPLERQRKITGWCFLAPATLLIFWMSFWSMIQAFIISLQTGRGAVLQFAGFRNYIRLFSDAVFRKTLGNTFIYLIIEVPVMILFALILASILNSPRLKFKGVFRTAIFLPCATSLVSYSLIFCSLFANDGFINAVLKNIGLEPVLWLSNGWSARMVIVIALIWRWTGYNMVFYLSGLQNIDDSIYEAARIDGCTPMQSFFKITIPLLKPIILLTAIMSTNGTFQLFDESMNLTMGGPGRESMSMSHYIYNTAFMQSPNFGYASTMSIVILVLVGTLSFIQMKIGDKRD